MTSTPPTSTLPPSDTNKATTPLNNTNPTNGHKWWEDYTASTNITNNETDHSGTSNRHHHYIDNMNDNQSIPISTLINSGSRDQNLNASATGTVDMERQHSVSISSLLEAFASELDHNHVDDTDDGEVNVVNDGVLGGNGGAGGFDNMPPRILHHNNDNNNTNPTSNHSRNNSTVNSHYSPTGDNLSDCTTARILTANNSHASSIIHVPAHEGILTTSTQTQKPESSYIPEFGNPFRSLFPPILSSGSSSSTLSTPAKPSKSPIDILSSHSFLNEQSNQPQSPTNITAIQPPFAYQLDNFNTFSTSSSSQPSTSIKRVIKPPPPIQTFGLTNGNPNTNTNTNPSIPAATSNSITSKPTSFSLRGLQRYQKSVRYHRSLTLSNLYNYNNRGNGIEPSSPAPTHQSQQSHSNTNNNPHHQEEEKDTEFKYPNHANLTNRCCSFPPRTLCGKICLSTCLIILLLHIILLPILIKIIIPQMIQHHFANDKETTVPLLVQKFTIKSIYSSTTTNNNDIVGGLTSSLSFSQQGYQIPFNIPISIKGPTTWRYSIDSKWVRDIANFSLERVPEASISGDWISLALFDLDNDILVRDGGVLIDMENAGVRIPNTRFIGGGGDDDGGIVGFSGRNSVVPIARAFVNGSLRCFMNGEKVWAPRIRLDSVVDVLIGGVLKITSVKLEKVYEFGNIIVDSGSSMNNPHPKTITDLGMHLSITKVKSLQSSATDLTALLNLTLPKQLYPNNSPFIFSTKGFSFRVGISGSSVLEVSVPKFDARSGDEALSFPVLLRPVWSDYFKNGTSTSLGGGNGTVLSNSTSTSSSSSSGGSGSSSSGSGSAGGEESLLGSSGTIDTDGTTGSKHNLGIRDIKPLSLQPLPSLTISPISLPPPLSISISPISLLPLASLTLSPLPSLTIPTISGLPPLPTLLPLPGLLGDPMSSLQQQPGVLELLSKILTEPPGSWEIDIDKVKLDGVVVAGLDDDGGVVTTLDWLNEILDEVRMKVPLSVIQGASNGGNDDVASLFVKIFETFTSGLPL
ncbi:hypothetical protein HDU76_002144 [Blyttiomyces sp. JEL0837]|nr:hypothetical protein HDU76_002144 [Blyttiomyces sp. JEL0837]